ncbi:hypothetical protein [Nitrospirillum iridis]|uniref:Uncharacterized protein n=1 Tax=Nitrospirillum iridis TaxID=765888 RepID=A0A7X0AZK1_9PROT|nr:hypothetical protein [Nitrospirillum iridis]MBB6253023.1 hypothetical protein [Nitrospirillum iridis]
MEVPAERPKARVKKWRSKNPAGRFTTATAKALRAVKTAEGSAQCGGGSRKGVRNGSTRVETEQAMFDAAPLVQASKQLPADIQERTGLTINPLYEMELMVRADALGARERLQALKELAAYTHSRAPSIVDSKVEVKRAEDWLDQLAAEEDTSPT